ncbi:phage portal protein [Sphingobium sp. AS12]|uniref:phage portal protein n=1 Tax=Sphingobium sp. AS12 TaxID=2849495 RepID=UPI001C318D7A|nr:phage portal protein [Sphingobium sp. AS12]MBV2147898.1 phage portal protein [Sphingobium sp. AS12]
MNWLTKAAKAVSSMLHPGAPPFLSQFLKRTRFDYRKEVGDGLDSSVVTAPVMWIGRALPEANLIVRLKKANGDVEDMPGHAMLALIQNPNPFYGDIALWMATLVSFLISGNAYWIIVRNGAGRPAELWYVPHWMMEPRWDQDGETFISYYRYSPGGGMEPSRIEPQDVVHFRHGIDPRNIRMGLSPLDGVIREIFIDLESSNFVASLLRNMGVPGVVISPKGGAMPAPEDVEATKTWFKQAFGGDNRGGPLVMGAPTDVQAYGFNPQQLNMSEGRDVAEERVCACLGIPAAVVGFGAGLQATKVGATMEEMRKLAWNNGVLPFARMFADELQRSLLGEFGNAAGQKVGWDISEVLALQEDVDKKVERFGKALRSAGITVYEYRMGIGMDADDSHKFYLRPINLIEVPAEGMRAPVAPRAPRDPVVADPKGMKAERRASPDAMKRGEAFVLITQRSGDALAKAFETPLRGVFSGMGAAAVEAALPLLEADVSLPKEQRGEKSDDLLVAMILEKLGIDAWSGRMRAGHEAQYLEVAKSIQEAAEHAGLGASMPDQVARAIVAAGGRRAGLIDLQGQSRSALFEALAEGRAAGEGAQALANRIGAHVEGGPWNSAEVRARVIARTETKYAQNISTIERGRAAGVGSFIIFDGRLGPGRSLLSHMARNGSIVTADEALAMAAAEHPNGTLSFAPNFEED